MANDDEKAREQRIQEIAAEAAHAVFEERQKRGEEVSRRDILAGAGMLGAGGLLGGAAASQAVEPASAATGEAGTVGTASSPVDIEAQDVNATALSAGQITLNGVTETSWPSGKGKYVTGTSVGDIATAVSNNEIVKLAPQTYTGSSTISVDLSSGNARAIDARGAVIDGGGVVLDVTGVNAWKAKARLVLLGGDWRSDSTAGSRAIRLTDAENNIIRPHYVREAEEGIEVRNVNHWSEGNIISLTDTENVGNALTFRGSSTTSGTGTNSFKNTEINIQGHCNSGGYVFKAETANLYDSEINISGFISGTRAGAEFDGNYRGTRMYLEFENTSNDGTGTGVTEGANGISVPPIETYARFQGLSKGFDVTTPWTYWKQTENSNYFDTLLPKVTTTDGNASANFGELLSTDGFGDFQFSDLRGTTGVFDGAQKNHDGSGTGLPRGPAIWDNTNSQWISVIDGTTFA